MKGTFEFKQINQLAQLNSRDFKIFKLYWCCCLSVDELTIDPVLRLRLSLSKFETSSSSEFSFSLSFWQQPLQGNSPCKATA